MRDLFSISSAFNFVKRIYTFRSVISAMAIQEIKRRYAGTIGGIAWSVIHPLLLILVFWFVFSIGFKIHVKGDIPFIVVFCCGLIPWVTFSESLMASTNAITGNPYLSTKTVFPTEILPVVHLVASLITHAIMLLILLVILFLCDISFSFWNFQFLYYFLGLLVFCLGLSWFFAAVNVFYRDIGHMLSVILNIWFWMTPIVWDIEMLPAKYHYIIQLNPMYYVVSGYKSAFIFHFPFWQRYAVGIYFWAICVFSFVAGGIVFKKLRPEFAEVL
jgi:lipopolysaccharide transport system permease protein/teichoic acid transport system permease protein